MTNTSIAFRKKDTERKAKVDLKKSVMEVDAISLALKASPLVIGLSDKYDKLSKLLSNFNLSGSCLSINVLNNDYQGNRFSDIFNKHSYLNVKISFYLT